jgi:serine kinase of HPr protein (carbohydrate metabolism regulator)
MTQTLSPVAREKIAEIAETILKLENLNIEHQDSLDLAVRSIVEALKAAYLAGMADHKKAKVRTPIEQRLADYLSGYLRNNPSARAFIIGYRNWQHMAKLERDRRDAQLLEGLPDEEVRAIAEGLIDLPELAREIAT